MLFSEFATCYLLQECNTALSNCRLILGRKNLKLWLALIIPTEKHPSILQTLLFTWEG